ncbi:MULTISPECIES: aminoacyl-tRNA deacylase [Pseudomonas]|uniref:YbaK/EbsC family protein n=2 Tax=Pseudomonas TaxID=286 RepID=A0A411MCN6_9PSED|nr:MULTISPECIES: YbaK/EbsC family protein [Pseudomonas]MDD1013020.1 YbaK/EbsC family protein [Pseudomonas rubra]MDD1040728.1 YbaK/EbsC family protein [Pseudomonas rubra]MDD1154927.1 YbaK/EbsC family protein [Pseudomonas rubra]QBF24567.1 YbaK/EbsC family protein [Pseudomonas tructae]
MRMAKTLQQCLDKAGCDYDIVSHPHSSTSLESARTAGVPAERVAKSVMLDDRHGNYLMAVLPANRHLDMSKVRATGAWQMTHESGLPHLFGDCERGAIPALGDAYSIKMLVDPTLTRQGDIYVEAGDHDHLIHMNMAQYLKLVPNAEVREVC